MRCECYTTVHDIVLFSLQTFYSKAIQLKKTIMKHKPKTGPPLVSNWIPTFIYGHFVLFFFQLTMIHALVSKCYL